MCYFHDGIRDSDRSEKCKGRGSKRKRSDSEALDEAVLGFEIVLIGWRILNLE